MKAFGLDNAKKLLKHWPYVYCPTLGVLFVKNANPKVGDIVIFKHGDTFTHTGFVTKVAGDRFWTIEGNTSGAKYVIAMYSYKKELEQLKKRIEAYQTRDLYRKTKSF